MIKITVDQLKDLNACQAGIDWFISCKKISLKAVVASLLLDNHADYARWLLSRLLTHPQNIKWAIYSAELSLNYFEKEYPTDNRPRKAIQAAKDFLAGKIDQLAAELAAESAARSAESAARSAAESAARSAESAARSAARSAESAARSAESAARSAWSAAESAARSAESAAESAARSARAKIDKKIMNYALELLGE
jgi:type IV secretory pathway VirB10-like protein